MSPLQKRTSSHLSTSTRRPTRAGAPLLRHLSDVILPVRSRWSSTRDAIAVGTAAPGPAKNRSRCVGYNVRTSPDSSNATSWAGLPNPLNSSHIWRYTKAFGSQRYTPVYSRSTFSSTALTVGACGAETAIQPPRRTVTNVWAIRVLPRIGPPDDNIRCKRPVEPTFLSREDLSHA